MTNNSQGFIQSAYAKKANEISNWFSVYKEFDEEVKRAVSRKAQDDRNTATLNEYCIYYI